MAASLEVGGWRAELDGLLDRFGRLFVRAAPRGQAGRYLEGLLGPVERKNGWQLAEAIGDARPWRTQRVLSHVLWDEEAARDLCREHAVERLGAEDAVLVVNVGVSPLFMLRDQAVGVGVPVASPLRDNALPIHTMVTREISPQPRRLSGAARRRAPPYKIKHPRPKGRGIRRRDGEPFSCRGE